MTELPAAQTSAETLKEIKELVDEVYSLKLANDVAEKKYKEAKNRLSEIMKNAEVDKMAGDTCNASLSLKTSVSCPKEDDKKLALFKYLAAKDGAEVGEGVTPAFITDLANHPTLLRMLTINAKTFSSWHDKEIEAKAQAGDYEFKLSMVEPYDYYSVGLRKRSKK